MPDYRFRPVTRADLPMLADWLRDPVVAAWWPGPDRQIALVAEDMANPVMRQVIASLGGTPVGYAQYYPARHWPAPHFADLAPDAVAIDLFAAPLGLGQGGAWLRALGDLLLDQAPLLAIDPAPANLRAIRAYEKAGFSGDAIRIDSEGQPVRVMTRHR
ncbi:GNAT family N-acetyltransferase [Paracoccus spongiarum]|uniref:GNAT family N-acetyltransferase n=1 Tax=Paracoccus spongiarum TaxID=3064387 RepID=A0ABT9JAE0_9RHOB|nr:GNAT family N-acetyltransferase [Paracoccus sp. 2205BS29-5]MDP5306786.1 GNAT family N-acetyltransferase [Paracoccus sp. 2205BS29-5]